MCSKEAVTEFLNIDLDVHGDAGDVAALLGAIEGAVLVLRHEGRDASVELAEQFASPEETALGMIDLVGGFRPDVRSIWDRLERRTLDVGIRAAGEPNSTSFAFSARTVALLAGLGVDIVFTVYAPLRG
jgi:hypothetical protein